MRERYGFASLFKEYLSYRFGERRQRFCLMAKEGGEAFVSRKPEAEARQLDFLRKVYSGLLITGPFSIVLGFTGGIMALNDRLKLRSMVVGEKDDMVYVASEEAAIRVMEPNAENIRAPRGGEPVIVKVKEGVIL